MVHLTSRAGKPTIRCSRTGLQEAGLRLRLGTDRLPSTLHTGCVIVESAGHDGATPVLLVMMKDDCLPCNPCPCPGFPGEGALSFKPLKRSSATKQAAASSTPKMHCLETVIRTSVDWIQEGRKVHVLSTSPFSGTVYLADVLSKVCAIMCINVLVR